MNIDEIGERLVHCELACVGIINEPKIGVLPRCLILENNECSADNRTRPDCIVVGISPGISGPRERGYYMKEGISYESVKEYFFSGSRPISREKYFSQLRKIVGELGLGTAILWTDLCKCEDKTKGISPPMQTFRTCVRNFLRNELELFPAAPLIAVGNQSFQALCYLFPDRFVIGVPHPTGSYGNFSQLFNEKERLKTCYKNMARLLKDEQGYANSVRLFPPARSQSQT